MNKTLEKAIKELADIRPHTYSDETVAGWFSTLDGDISTYLNVEGAPITHAWPGDRGKELFIPAPFDNIYSLYGLAQIDFLNQDYSQYANTYAMYNARLDEYLKDYIRRNRPASAGTFIL